MQAVGLSPALPLFARAAECVPLPPRPLPIVLADYGASEGRNSLAPLTAAIAALRKRAGPERAISVVHTDLPDNDFAALFETLAGPESYLRGDAAVFPSAVGRSFYEQLLPAASVTLGWSSWALQWLSRAPGPIPDHVQIAYSHDRAARALFAAQAATDLVRFFTHRGAELCPGGRLVVLTMALAENGEFGYRGVVDAIYSTLQALASQGFLRAEELSRMVIPTVARSRAELLAPFSGTGRCAGLVAEEAEVFLAEDGIWAEFERTRDEAAFGAQWAGFSRASIMPSLAAALDGGGNDPRAALFADRLEAGMAHRLAARPEPMLIPLARMLLVKEA